MDGILGLQLTSFFDMEVRVLRVAIQVASQVMPGLLEKLDEQVFKQRDPARYQVIDIRQREVDTIFGGTVRFKRRYYLDRRTGERVFLLDEALKLPRRARQSPGLRNLSVMLATNGSYRQTRGTLEQVFGARIMSHESIRQQVLATGKRLKELEQQLPIEPEEAIEHKARFLFIEMDGIHCHLQRKKHKGKKNMEIRVTYVHEGWEEHPERQGKFRAMRLRVGHLDPSTSDLEDCWGAKCGTGYRSILVRLGYPISVMQGRIA